MSEIPAGATFPYMFWAHTEAARSPYSLAMSGMPPPDPAVFLSPGLPDLGPPAAEALPALEARLAELFGTEPERVLVTPGASGAMLVCALRLFAGARVVTELPSYEPFRALPARLAADTRIVERTPERGWALPVGAVSDALAGCGGGGPPGHVFVATPHNPTGHVLPPDALVELAGLAARAGGVLVANETYMEFAPPAERVHAFHLAPNALSIGTLTKAYGLGPLRVGWILLGAGLAAERDLLRDAAYLGWVDPPTCALRAGMAALGRLEALLAPTRRFERESRPLLARWLAESELVEGELGRYGLTGFPRVVGVDDTRALARSLADEHGVDVVPGEFFGRAGHVRLGYALPPATLEAALERLEAGIRAFRARP